MPTIDEMQIVINAKTEGMRAELAQSAQAVKQFADKTRAELGGVLGLMGKLGAAGASGGALGLLGATANMHPLFFALNQAAGVFGQIDKWRKDTLGWATDLVKLGQASGMTAERLQELFFAAEQTKVSNEAMSKGLVEFKKGVDQAINGGGALKKVFDDYGISMTTANGATKTYETLLMELSAALGRTEKDADKAAIATIAFGESGKALLPVFGEGVKKLDEFGRKARESGKVSSEAMVESVSLIDLEWNKWLDGMKRRLTEFGNLVKTVGAEMIAAAKGAEWVPTALVDAAYADAQRRVTEATARIEALKARMASGLPEPEAPRGPWSRPRYRFGDTKTDNSDQELAEQLKKLEVLEKRLEDARAQFRSRHLEQFGPPEPLSTVKPEIPGKPEKLMREPAAPKDHTPSLLEYMERQIRQNAAYGEGLNKTAGEVAALRAEEEILARAKHYDIQITADLRMQLDHLKDRLIDTVDAAETWKQKLQRIQDVGRAVSSGLERAFGEFTRTGKVNFREMTQSILQDLAMIAFRAAVIGPLFGTGGNNQGLFGNLLAGALGTFGGARAGGGSADAGKTYLVGEEGPELLRMGGASGTVIPANASRVMMGAARSASAGGQASADINVHVAAGPELLVTIDKRAERAVGAAAPQIAAAAVRTTERALPGMLRTAQQRRL